MYYKYALSVDGIVVSDKNYEDFVKEIESTISKMGAKGQMTRVAVSRWTDKATMTDHMFNSDGTQVGRSLSVQYDNI